MVSLMLRAMITNLDLMPHLIVVYTSPRNVILVNQSDIFWSITGKVICHIGPLQSLIPWEEEAICMTKNLAIPPFAPENDVLV